MRVGKVIVADPDVKKNTAIVIEVGRKKLCTCVSGSCFNYLFAGILENATKKGADASQGAALT